MSATMAQAPTMAQLRTSTGSSRQQPATRTFVAGNRRFKLARHTPVTAQAATNGALATRPATSVSPFDDAESRYLAMRADHVQTHFPGALGVDDAMQRLEIALYPYGFQNDNSIAMVNLCRDEITQVLKHKIDQVFGSSFSTHGLGGVLTCGVTGVGAGLSHSPLCETSGKERYVFFSFPHIAIDSKGVVGNVSRPGRASMSCACGALIKSLGDYKKDGLECNCKEPGVHEPLDIELSILKQRLARKLKSEGQTDESVKAMDLVGLTKAAERTISDDLEFLISKAVDVNKADYAVVTGVQIHNWAEQFDSSEPNLEFVWLTSTYVVVDGVKTELDLSGIPGLTPRQIRLLASAPDAHTASPLDAAEAVCNTGGNSTLREIDPPYMYSSKNARKQQAERLKSFAALETTDAAAALPGSRQVPRPAGSKGRPLPQQPVVTDRSQQYWAVADKQLEAEWARFLESP